MKKGLTRTQAAANLTTHGYNELPSEKPKNLLKIAVEVMKEPMFLLLISCGLLYILIGDLQEGVILLSTISLIIFITFYQYQKTEKALTALKKLSSPRVLVIRDEVEVRIPGREVVPGDIIVLNEGDRIAADCELFETHHLVVDESILTGESLPVEKFVQPNHNQLFTGTLIVQGKGYAKVLKTGVHTKFGQIGLSLQSIEQDETRLQKEMKVLIRNLFIIGGVISVLVILAFYFTRGNFVQSLLNGLASAMAILPEEFPVVLTIFLALGAWRLSKKNVLTRTPSAIETLGSATVLCTDKTGTITQNKMTVSVVYNGNETIASTQFSSRKEAVERLIQTGFLACQQNSIDPMEKAIEEAYRTLFSGENGSYSLVREYPLSKRLLAMTRVVTDSEGANQHIACKGAPETIFDLCHLSNADRDAHAHQLNEFAKAGYRVLAVAQAVDTDHLPDTQKGFSYRFLGLLALEDPVRPEVPNAIEECKTAGIRVIMITGDFPVTAKSIAAQIGMDTAQEVLTGKEIHLLTDDELKAKIQHTHLFARVEPEQKLRIVNALIANKEIVAMTGDGVNDAPALKAAHIGVAMGNKGTDVAREASSLVLLDDNFASIVSAIRMGRKIFDNLQKAMSYIIAVHIPIIGLTLVPALFSGMPLLLLPLHIVFMELIIDPACSVAFENEQEEKNIMTRPPRDPNHQFFGAKRILDSTMQGLLLFAMTLVVYFISKNKELPEEATRAVVFVALIMGNLFLILTNLSKTRSFVAVFTERNWAIWIIFIGAALMLFFITTIPFLQNIFSFQNPGYRHFIPSILGAISILVVHELAKLIHLKRRK